jgi:hypothetical protein
MSPEVLLVTAGIELGHRHRRRIRRRAQLHPRGPRDGLHAVTSLRSPI